MKRLWKITTIFALCFSLSACANQTSQQPKLVSAIYISGIHQDAPLSCFYSEPKKMETILYYLRSLDPMGRPKTDPERIMGESYRIHIEYADGGQSIYRQHANRFLSKDAHPWQTIDPKKAAILRPLLEGIQVTNAKGT